MPSMKWWALRSTWVRPSSETSARSCWTLTPGCVVRSSADMKWPGPSFATRAAFRIDL